MSYEEDSFVVADDDSEFLDEEHDEEEEEEEEEEEGVVEFPSRVRVRWDEEEDEEYKLPRRIVKRPKPDEDFIFDLDDEDPFLNGKFSTKGWGPFSPRDLEYCDYEDMPLYSIVRSGNVDSALLSQTSYFMNTEFSSWFKEEPSKTAKVTGRLRRRSANVEFAARSLGIDVMTVNMANLGGGNGAARDYLMKVFKLAQEPNSSYSFAFADIFSEKTPCHLCNFCRTVTKVLRVKDGDEIFYFLVGGHCYKRLISSYCLISFLGRLAFRRKNLPSVEIAAKTIFYLQDEISLAFEDVRKSYKKKS